MRRQLCIGGVSKGDLLLRLHAAGVRLNAYAEALFADDRFVTSPARSLVETVQVTVAELGLPGGATFERLVAQAARRGLRPCPLELGPHLRLSLPDQAEGFVGRQESRNRAPPGSITVASAALSQDDETPKGFYLRRIEGVPWLRGYRSWDGHVWSGQDNFVFVVAAP